MPLIGFTGGGDAPRVLTLVLEHDEVERLKAESLTEGLVINLDEYGIPEDVRPDLLYVMFGSADDFMLAQMADGKLGPDTIITGFEERG